RSTRAAPGRAATSRAGGWGRMARKPTPTASQPGCKPGLQRSTRVAPGRAATSRAEAGGGMARKAAPAASRPVGVNRVYKDPLRRRPGAQRRAGVEAGAGWLAEQLRLLPGGWV